MKDIKDYLFLSKKNFHNRFLFWPSKLEEKSGSFKMSNDLFLFHNSVRNFWSISKTYYHISWILFTADFYTISTAPYKRNILNEKDEIHRDILIQSIQNNGMNMSTIMGQAHLSCELAIKAIIFHQKDKIEEKYYPKGHDLKKLVEDHLNKHNKNEVLTQYKKWEYGDPQLLENLNGSGARFVNQRYGDYNMDKQHFSPVNFSRFIHEVLDLSKLKA